MMNGNKMLSTSSLGRSDFSRTVNNGRGRTIEESKQSSLSKTENQQNISFNRNSQLAMSNNFETTGIRMVNKPSTGNQMEVIHTNKIHFFKFDQKIVTFFNVDQERKQREVLNIDFNIPIRFCSI